MEKHDKILGQVTVELLMRMIDLFVLFPGDKIARLKRRDGNDQR